MYNNHMDIEQEVNVKETLPPQLAEILKPQQTGIIVVDVMDAYFSRGGALAQLVGFDTTALDAAAERIKGFLEEARKFSPATVVFTRMIERPDSLPPNLARKMELGDTPPLVVKDGPGWSYYGVTPLPGEHQIEKVHYNAFTGTDLNEHLQSKGVSSLIVVGGYGSRCVARTAESAADDYGYDTFVPPDLIANPDSLDKPGNAPAVDEIPGFFTVF